MRGEPDRVCAHLWVLQDITDHTAFAAFAPLKDWSREEVRVQPGSAQLHPLEASLPSLAPGSQGGPRPWPAAVFSTQMILSWTWILQ